MIVNLDQLCSAGMKLVSLRLGHLYLKVCSASIITFRISLTISHCSIMVQHVLFDIGWQKLFNRGLRFLTANSQDLWVQRITFVF